MPYDIKKIAEQLRGNAMHQIGERILIQDNRCTADPIFIVYDRKRIYGMDVEYAENNIAWLNTEDYYNADAKKHKALDRYYRRYGQEPSNWRRTAYTVQDTFVTACFTEFAAEEYIRRNRHHMKDPYTYAGSLYRNDEMKAIRNFLMTIPPREDQTSVNDWTVGTFPDALATQSRTLAVVEEAVELALAAGCTPEEIQRALLVPVVKASHGNTGSIRKEAADIQITLYAVAGQEGFSLSGETDDKMAINRSRPAEYYAAKNAEKQYIRDTCVLDL